MLIPISIRNKDNKLVVHHNRGTSIVDYPFKPFILLEKEFFSDVPGQIVSLTKVPQEEKTDYIKAEFFSYNELLDFKKRNQDKSNKMLSNSILEQIYIIQPDFFKAFPHNTDLKILYFDIEIATKGDDLFPKFTTNEILCIGYSVWSYDNGQKKKLIQGICKNYDEKNCSDKEILEEFFDIIQKYDPDIIAGYNSEDFDLPYVIGRAGLLNINTKRVGRGGAPYTHIQENKEHLFIPGRIHFDIYSSNAGVFKDQTLSGIKSKTLKDVARWFKIKKTIKANDQWIEEPLEDIEVQDHIENLKKLYNENKELLYKYQDDDVYRTEAVGNIYIRNVITLAEMMGTSLESIINMYSSFIPKLFLARNMHTLGLICTETNFQRYNIYTGTIAKLSKDLKFEGAISELYRDGYFNNVWKIDVSSQYPSAIQTFNLGSDTTKLISIESYTGKYSHSEDENYHWYNIPSAFDKESYKYNLIIRVKKKDGFLRKSITELKKKRKELKNELQKETDESKKSALHSQQWAIKIVLNSIYGLLGLKTSIYGDMTSSVMTTSLCRWYILKLMQSVKNQLVESDSVVGDTPVYIKYNKTNEIDILPIEDLHLSDEIREDKTKEEYKILTRNYWKSPIYTKKHIVNKPIYRTKISDGYVDCTEDHSLFNLNTEEITPKNIIIDQSRIETVKDICSDNKDYEYPWNEPEFCWLIGILIAEGSVYIGKQKKKSLKCQVSFNGNNIELMKKVESLANEYFNKKLFKFSKFKLHDTMESSGVYKVQGGYNYIICSWLKSNCYCKKNNKNKKIPLKILNNNKVCKKSFLEGLMIGDGYKAINKENRKTESLDSIFKSLSAGIRFLWNELGSETCCNIRKDKLNVTSYKKRIEYNNGILRSIDRNIVQKNDIIKNNQNIEVFDISTEDGTFVTALGNIVLHNTDGLIINQQADAQEKTEYMTKELKKKFNITDNYLVLESEGNGERAYFYLAKNYIIEKSIGDYNIHGSSLKGSKSSKVVDRAVKLGIEYIFNNKPIEEVLNEAYDFTGLSIDDFIERAKMTKEKNDYDDQQDFRLFIAKQVELKTGQIVTSGTQMNFVVAKKPLPYSEFKEFYKGNKKYYTFAKYIDNISELDFSYYNDQIDKTLAKFGISKNNYITLNLFGDQQDKKPINKSKKLDIIYEGEL